VLSATDQIAVNLLADQHIDRKVLRLALEVTDHRVAYGYAPEHGCTMLKEARDIVEQARNGGSSFLTTVGQLGALKAHMDLTGLSNEAQVHTVRCWPSALDAAFTYDQTIPHQG